MVPMGASRLQQAEAAIAAGTDVKLQMGARQKGQAGALPGPVAWQSCAAQLLHIACPQPTTQVSTALEKQTLQLPSVSSSRRKGERGHTSR